MPPPNYSELTADLKLPSAPSSPYNPTHGGPPDLKRFIGGLKRNLWIVIATTVLSTSISYLYYKRQHMVFQAGSVLEFGSFNSALKRSVDDSVVQDDKAANTMVQMVKSRNVLSRVVTKLSLAKNKDSAHASADETEEANQKAIASLASAVVVTLRPNTRYIDVQASDEQPQIAASIANQVAASVLEEIDEQKGKTLEVSMHALIAESDRLREKLTSSELAMQDYKVQKNAISLDERKDVVGGRLRNVGEQLNNASRERLLLDTQLQNCERKQASQEEIQTYPVIANNGKVAAIVSLITDRTTGFKLLRERYGPKHPKYIAAESEIANLKHQLDEQLENAVVLLRSALESAKVVEAKLRDEMKIQEKEALDLEKLAVQYNILRRDMQTDQAVYESILARIKEVGVSHSEGLQAEQLRLSQLAAIPLHPVSPKANVIIGGGVGFGLLIGIAIIFLIVIQDNALRSLEDARLRIGLPILGVIETVAAKAQTKRRGSIVRTMEQAHEEIIADHAVCSEQVRELRTILSMKGHNTANASVLVASAVPKEGKTFTVTHLGVSFANQGLRTLLIDSDLRKPQLQNEFGLDKSSPGLADILLEEIDIAAACQQTLIPNLSVIPAGKRVVNSTELLAMAGLKNIISSACALGYERIIIDSAPLIPVSDTLVIAKDADSLLMVTRCNSTPSGLVLEAIRKLADANCAPLGMALNRLERGSSGYYYRYYTSYKSYTNPAGDAVTAA